MGNRDYDTTYADTCKLTNTNIESITISQKVKLPYIIDDPVELKKHIQYFNPYLEINHYR